MTVKCFEEVSVGGLEKRINKFFEENNIILIDVRYSSCYESESYVNYSAMIVYREDD